MNKYVVFSFDLNEQQCYTDYVTADTSEKAVEQVLDANEDVVAGFAYTPADLRDIAVVCEQGM